MRTFDILKNIKRFRFLNEWRDIIGGCARETKQMLLVKENKEEERRELKGKSGK